jgi:hypothetical protein
MKKKKKKKVSVVVINAAIKTLPGFRVMKKKFFFHGRVGDANWRLGWCFLMGLEILLLWCGCQNDTMEI